MSAPDHSAGMGGGGSEITHPPSVKPSATTEPSSQQLGARSNEGTHEDAGGQVVVVHKGGGRAGFLSHPLPSLMASSAARFQHIELRAGSGPISCLVGLVWGIHSPELGPSSLGRWGGRQNQLFWDQFWHLPSIPTFLSRRSKAVDDR